MEKIYGDGDHWGFHWLFDDMIEYDVREKTIKEKFEFNDRDKMATKVELAVDYKVQEMKVNYIHSKIGKDQMDIKILTTLNSAAKQVIPQYTAAELNLNKREEAEQKIFEILEKEYPEFFVECARVRMTDVDIPLQISQAAEATAKQAELNRLEESKAVAAENRFKAAEWDAKTKDILSQPAMLKLKELEIQEMQAKADMMWATKGSSRYGSGNVFGQTPNLLFQR